MRGVPGTPADAFKSCTWDGKPISRTLWRVAFVSTRGHVISSRLSDLLAVADWISARNNSQDRRRAHRWMLRGCLTWLEFCSLANCQGEKAKSYQPEHPSDLRLNKRLKSLLPLRDLRSVVVLIVRSATTDRNRDTGLHEPSRHTGASATGVSVTVRVRLNSTVGSGATAGAAGAAAGARSPASAGPTK